VIELHSFPTRRSSDLMGSGSVDRMLSISLLSQGCNTAFVVCRTPFIRTSPVAGWNNVSCFAVPFRMYSCVHAGRAFGRSRPGARSEEHTSELQSPYDL